MKFQSIFRLALLAGVAFFSSFSAYAQADPAPTARPKISREAQQQKRYDQVARELNLTPEQKVKFEQTDRAYDEKIKAKRTVTREELARMRQERINAHRALLTREQAAKYDQMQAKKQHKHDGRKAKKAGKMHKKGDKMHKHDEKSRQETPGNRTREN